MGTPYLSELRVFAVSFAPKGWAQCNGQILPINQNQALFALLGTNFGGNGQTTFALPDLRGRVPVDVGSGFVLGQTGGEASHTLSMNEMPTHTHAFNATSDGATTSRPGSGVILGSVRGQYAPPDGGPTTLNAGSITATGGSQPHDNQQPYLVLNICIALQGIFPSRN